MVLRTGHLPDRDRPEDEVGDMDKAFIKCFLPHNYSMYELFFYASLNQGIDSETMSKQIRNAPRAKVRWALPLQ